ncbi:DNA replication licensing factor MCM2 [Nematocida sp. AWRm77]|nr:DNA replication licensing factor MCM2 [Nematocida sp. AWRm77]
MDRESESSSVSGEDEYDRISLEDSEEDEGEDLFQNNYMEEYRHKPELDEYEVDEADEEYIPPLTTEQFERAEKEIAEIWGSSPGRLPSQEETPSTEDGEDGEESGDSLGTQEWSSDDALLLEKHVAETKVRERVKKEVVKFLRTFGEKKYVEGVRQMASLNMQSLWVDYFDLEAHSKAIAACTLSSPCKVLPILNEALQVVVSGLFPKYSYIRPFLIFRVVNIPALDTIRSLRNFHLNRLVKITGIITKRSRVYPMLSLVKYNCTKCKALLGPFLVESDAVKPNRCLECQTSGPFSINVSETVYKNFQRLTVQEVPESAPPGRLPRSKDVVVLHDLIDYAKPGDEVEMVGVYKNNYSGSSAHQGTSMPVFSTVIEALSFVKRGDDAALFSITPEDEKEIKRLAQQENILSLVVSSIAPSIHGHREAKRAIALSIFGGVPKHFEAKHTIRGDINVLLLGDPGMAKSQLLKYVEKISHRAVFATGQGASAVGLTAMVRKDPATGEWTLEGGALVLADKGVCLIDEFDKMKDTDRVSIHEAMEQQSISISKAGIVTSLQARCAVIAAANPVRGKYNPAYTFSQNVNLSDPIISRFDIICVVKDECNEQYDKELAQFIVGSHASVTAGGSTSTSTRSSSDALPGAGAISQDTLRKYISYARERVHPKIEGFDTERVKSLYSALRKESLSAGGVPVTVRHIESIIRMAEASARIHLREKVLKKDVDLAIKVALDSFCGTQKTAVKRMLQKKFSKYCPALDEEMQGGLEVLSSMLDTTENTGPAGPGPAQASVRMKDLRHKLASLGMSYKPMLTSAAFLKHYKVSSCGEYVIKKQ